MKPVAVMHMVYLIVNDLAGNLNIWCGVKYFALQ
jgi:hypothetical protein